MQQFKNIGDVARHFIKTKAQKGAQAILTGGPRTPNYRTSGTFMLRGVDVTVRGDYGNRVVTLNAIDDSKVNRQKEIKASRARNPMMLIGQRKDLLISSEDKEPVYVEGNKTTIIRQLRRWGYAGRYNIAPHSNGIGHEISVRSEKWKALTFRTEREVVKHFHTAPVGSQAILYDYLNLRKSSVIECELEFYGIFVKAKPIHCGFLLTLLKPSEFKPALGNGGNPNWISNVFPKLVEDGPALLIESSRVKIAQYLGAVGYSGRYSMENVSDKPFASSTKFMVKIGSMPGNNAPKSKKSRGLTPKANTR